MCFGSGPLAKMTTLKMVTSRAPQWMKTSEVWPEIIMEIIQKDLCSDNSVMVYTRVCLQTGDQSLSKLMMRQFANAETRHQAPKS